MKFVVISDTHGQHQRIELPAGDAIIHAGDVSSRGRETEIADFLHWFKNLDFQYKIFIAGNHDFFFERASPSEIEKLLPENITYLCDSGVTINNIRIWGSPVTPWFYDWAFNRHRGALISEHWKLIPNDTKILITHGPVAGILDSTIHGERVGCEDLLMRVREIKPLFHICGHIHEAYGQRDSGQTHFVNASVLDEKYYLKNKAITFEI